MNSPDDVAIPEPHALTAKNTDATIRMLRRPNRSAIHPARNAPTAQPSSIDATLNPVTTLSDLKAVLSPSTVPLITPESKPKRKPPIVATMLMRAMNRRLSDSAEGSFFIFRGAARSCLRGKRNTAERPFPPPDSAKSGCPGFQPSAATRAPTPNPPETTQTPEPPQLTPPRRKTPDRQIPPGLPPAPSVASASQPPR